MSRVPVLNQLQRDAACDLYTYEARNWTQTAIGEVLGGVSRSAIQRAVAELSKAPKGTVHPSISLYSHNICRCEGCRAAWASYHRDYRERINK